MPTSAGHLASSNEEKGSNDRHSNIGACNTASWPPKHQTPDEARTPQSYAESCAKCSDDGHFAQKRSVEIGGDRFLCRTLWTDFALAGNYGAAMKAAQSVMLDYARIGIGRGQRALDPMNLLEVHQAYLAWLEAELAAPFAGRTFVVTHYAPHPMVAPSRPLFQIAAR